MEDLSDREKCKRIIQSWVFYQERWPTDKNIAMMVNGLKEFCDSQINRESEAATKIAKAEEQISSCCLVAEKLHKELWDLYFLRGSQLRKDADHTNFRNGQFQSLGHTLKLLGEAFNGEPFNCGIFTLEDYGRQMK